MRTCALIFFFIPLFPMSVQLNTLAVPDEIVISDEIGVRERIEVGPKALEKEMALWAMKELLDSNKELREQLGATKKKWYVAVVGFITTFVPLVVCGVELYSVSHECD